MAVISVCNAQNQMMALIGKSMAKVQEPTAESVTNCVAELKRIDAMYPDSLAPKYYTALQSLNYAVSNPHDEQTETLMAEAMHNERIFLHGTHRTGPCQKRPEILSGGDA